MPATTAEYDRALATNQDAWVPGCGGTEQPFRTRTGCRLLWCFNPGQRRHAYIDVDQDRELTNQEADAALGR